MLRRKAIAGLGGVRKFGTIQAVADTFTHLHSVSGLPWLVLVPVATFGLRATLTLPLSIWQRKRLIKQQELRKLVQAIPPVVKMRLAAAVNDAKASEASNSSGTATKKVGLSSTASSLTPEQISLLSVKEMRKRQKALFKEYGVQLWKNMTMPAIQIPLWVMMSLGLRHLTSKSIIDVNHVEWLGTLGSMDLSLPFDQMPMLLPIVLGTLSMINVEHNDKMLRTTTTTALGIETAQSKVSKVSHALTGILNVSRLSCIFLIAISSQTSILLTLYWISSQLYSVLQNAILDRLWPYQK
ncbi:HBL363Wp [Eremothecium sinecaudum]|uniref:HBL363Wp n=1 Tax=Eremothecium sinecaudum TaxID=45286 RepID=A0A120K0N9_9SACH|nr:HBL363Wp [Eremothecium sinecaudum]AMD18539.1 HBL363Wp [Eremothecium sinecaudum]